MRLRCLNTQSRRASRGCGGRPPPSFADRGEVWAPPDGRDVLIISLTGMEQSLGAVLVIVLHQSLTHLGEGGASLLVLMAKSRHKKPENVRRYFHTSAEAIAEVTSLLAPSDGRRRVRRYPACRRCREGERGASLGARGRQCAGAPPGGCRPLVSRRRECSSLAVAQPVGDVGDDGRVDVLRSSVVGGGGWS